MLYLAVAGWLLCSQGVYAETVRYVRDTMYVPLRSGPSTQHRILRNVASGSALTVVEGSASAGYVQVRDKEGGEGWMEEQYLTDKPIARVQLAGAEAELQRQRDQGRQLREQLQAARGEQSGSARELSELKTANTALTAQLEEIKTASASALATARENRELQATNATLGAKVEALTVENTQLAERAENRSFLHGAYAVLIGVVIALLVPRLWPRKKRSEWG